MPVNMETNFTSQIVKMGIAMFELAAHTRIDNFGQQLCRCIHNKFDNLDGAKRIATDCIILHKNTTKVMADKTTSPPHTQSPQKHIYYPQPMSLPVLPFDNLNAISLICVEK